MDIYQLLKKPFFGRYQVQWDWPIGNEKQLQWERVLFDSQSGGRIVGLYGRAFTEEVKGGIVCAHPMGATAKGFYLKHGHGDMLRRNGYNVLLFDFNGFGESSNGDFNYPLDVVAAGKYMRAISPTLPIGLLGISFGGAWAICALANSGHVYEAAVSECPFTTLDEYWYRYRFAYFMLRVISIIMPGVAKRLRPIDQISEIEKVKSLFLIYGDRDTTTPQEMGYRLKARSNVPVEIWIVRNAKHTRGFSTERGTYERQVIGFFDRFLAGDVGVGEAG